MQGSHPLNHNNTNYLTIRITQSGKAAGVADSGFDGIPLDAGKAYEVSLYAHGLDGARIKNVRVTLELEDGTVCGEERFSGVGEKWKKFEGAIKSTRTTDNARLVVTTEGKGTLCLDMVSLFPQDTFKGRKNGMRKDLVQALVDLHPKFLRFPGGCIAHGDGLANIYRWKDTIGDVAEREPNWNRWGITRPMVWVITNTFC